MFTFDAATFEMIQNLLFPLLKTLIGFDTEEWVGEQSELFIAVGEGFADVAQLFIVVGTALEDGKLSAEEIEDIITKAVALPDAIDEIVDFFDDDDEPEDDS